jgi:hypothetical protein
LKAFNSTFALKLLDACGTKGETDKAKLEQVVIACNALYEQADVIKQGELARAKRDSEEPKARLTDISESFVSFR